MPIHRYFTLGILALLMLTAFVFGALPVSPTAHAQTDPTVEPSATLTPTATETLTSSVTIATITPTPTNTPEGTVTVGPTATTSPITTEQRLYLPWLTETRASAPEITAPSRVDTDEDTPIRIPIRVIDNDTAPNALQISATLQSTAVITTMRLETDNGITYTLWLTPSDNAFGQTEVRLFANDGQATAQATILVVVQAVNDAPVIIGLADLAMRPSVTRSVTFSVTDVESDSQQLLLGLDVANTTLLPITGTVLEGNGITRTLTLSPSNGLTGTSVISLSVSDGALTTTLPFTLTVAADACPDISANSYITIAIQPYSSGGLYYKDNRLTDENADFRLSILGYTPTNAITNLVDYGGDTDVLAPRIYGVVKPKRVITITQSYERYDWIWDENAAPPYGTRGGVNHEWAASVIDLSTQQDEPIYIPERPGGLFETGIWEGDYKAMVLYAAEHEILITYTRNDRVDHGYAMYLANLCVDPNLVQAYRDQLLEGRRNSGWLPALRNSDIVGTARGSTLTVAVRDTGSFLDPRSRKDWWQGY